MVEHLPHDAEGTDVYHLGIRQAACDLQCQFRQNPTRLVNRLPTLVITYELWATVRGREESRISRGCPPGTVSGVGFISGRQSNN